MIFTDAQPPSFPSLRAGTNSTSIPAAAIHVSNSSSPGANDPVRERKCPKKNEERFARAQFPLRG